MVRAILRGVVVEVLALFLGASVACAGEWADKANRVIVDTTQARNAAETLPVRSPWVLYEFLREGAVEDGRTATKQAAAGALFANIADSWWEDMVDAEARGDTATADMCARQYAISSKQAGDLLKGATASASVSRNQSTQCRMWLMTYP